jgi:mRNA interferase MazF
MARFVKGDVVVVPFPFSNALENSDFRIGSLPKSSNIRPNKIFTADRQMIQSKVGELHPEKLEAVIDRLITIFRR